MVSWWWVKKPTSEHLRKTIQEQAYNKQDSIQKPDEQRTVALFGLVVFSDNHNLRALLTDVSTLSKEHRGITACKAATFYKTVLCNNLTANLTVMETEKGGGNGRQSSVTWSSATNALFVPLHTLSSCRQRTINIETELFRETIRLNYYYGATCCWEVERFTEKFTDRLPWLTLLLFRFLPPKIFWAGLPHYTAVISPLLQLKQLNNNNCINCMDTVRTNKWDIICKPPRSLCGYLLKLFKLLKSVFHKYWFISGGPLQYQHWPPHIDFFFTI